MKSCNVATISVSPWVASIPWLWACSVDTPCTAAASAGISTPGSISHSAFARIWPSGSISTIEAVTILASCGFGPVVSKSKPTIEPVCHGSSGPGITNTLSGFIMPPKYLVTGASGEDSAACGHHLRLWIALGGPAVKVVQWRSWFQLRNCYGPRTSSAPHPNLMLSSSLLLASLLATDPYWCLVDRALAKQRL